MARRQTKTKRPPLLPAGAMAMIRRVGSYVSGFAIAFLGLGILVALASFDANDPTLNRSANMAVNNLLGFPGAAVADLLLQTLGLASIVIAFPLFGWAWRIGSRRGLPWFWTHLLVLPVAAMGFALAVSQIPAGAGWPFDGLGYGGLLGDRLSSGMDSIREAIDLAIPGWAISMIGLLAGVPALLAAVGIAREEWMAIIRAIGRFVRMLGRGLWAVARRVRPDGAADDLAPKPRKPVKKRKTKEDHAERMRIAKNRIEPGSVSTKEGRRAKKERQGSLFPEQNGFRLPPLDLLNKPKAMDPSSRLSEDALEQNARLLVTVLEDFGIEGKIVHVRPGPVVTLYELEPAPGVKSARVIGLADDIARSMSAISARVAVIPGRNAIGIELPNSLRETVPLREILASQNFDTSTAKLPLTLGKDIGGAPVIADLASMPHLLVAGTTGSGKSVGLNAMILSLLYRLPPERCKLIMIDPKMLELSIYDDIPHLLTPVVTEPKKAVVALKWAVREMEERYRAMSKIGVRNLAAYNKQVAEAEANGEPLKRQVQTGFDKETGQPVYEEQAFDFKPLPMIVIVIDEMADLMLVAGKDVEAVVQRLAQMARAAGLHLIMATQRPSVDVITGTIKANFPTRISFQVTSKIDSRTILGEQGAEQLLGQGDMLFMAGGGRITRVHGAFVSDGEVEKVVTYLKKQAAPSYVGEVTEEPEEGFDSPFIPGPSREDGNADASLYDKAVDVVLRDRRVSTSYIQRRLRIGYNRAASLIEEMEDQAVISAPNHAGKREILVPQREEDA
ncbi:DNA translocase FtsK 4TM domain-containing protein [Iodidimonas muriae]|uniref:DNA translocase FtsK 4TM domain-containing protein n=1 Tax=Iodidimonas muriae TaxID=261467 RepID=UPI001E4A202E|nr:DNA translocase FtsK 4TM domain-containing protein [Iodidimonas muriae]